MKDASLVMKDQTFVYHISKVPIYNKTLKTEHAVVIFNVRCEIFASLVAPNGIAHTDPP